MLKSQESRDFELACNLHRQDNHFGITENAVIPENRDKENYKPRTLIDHTLELIDPTPNIYTLFVQFNERFFWNVLLPVEVKWSNRMTSCAGICSFQYRSRNCIISLSAPLLKLRPRKDLVETLLHEMIHGYLFLTNNNRDRDGHGPEFCKHMNRINEAAGTNITIYHSFHDEVKLYKQHWWRCNGLCQKRAPYFGTVRRAMNRAPGPNDFWWKEHQQTCGGQFIKIKEPENFKSRAPKNKEKPQIAAKNNGFANNMSKWLKKPTTTTTVTVPKFASTPKNTKPLSNTQNSLQTNNVHGWGTAGPNGSNNSLKTATPVSSTRKVSSSGVLGGSNTGLSNLLSKFDNNKKRQSNTNVEKPERRIDTFISPKASNPIAGNSRSSNVEMKLVECPVCSNFVLSNDINKHVDLCLITTNKKEIPTVSSTATRTETDTLFVPKRKLSVDSSSSKQPKLDTSETMKTANCPICNKSLELIDINRHLDKCLLGENKQDSNSIITLDETNHNEAKNDSMISISSTSSGDSSIEMDETTKDVYPISEPRENKTKASSHKCLVCNMLISPEISLNDHLEDCIGSVFNDDSSLTNSDELESETVSDVSFDHNDKYPCPVCMQLISESLMNQHLDVCLKCS